MYHGRRAPLRGRYGRVAPIFVCLRHAVLCSMVVVTLNTIAPPPLMSQSKTAGEYEVKAAFLYNFAKFVEWPEGSFANSQSPFAICVLGTDPFGRTLDQILAGKMVGNRPVTLQRFREVARARQCQMLFVSPSESGRLPQIMDQLHGASVLVVGETDGFAQAGGAVQFTLDEDRVRFAINPDAAERAGLRLSSKLLALAKIVHDDTANGGRS